MKGKLKRNRWLMIVGACLGGAAIAASVGKFYCGTACSFEGPYLQDGEAHGFLRATINPKVDSWVDAKGSPKTVELCNGSVCAKYRYRKGTVLWEKISEYRSSWVGSNVGGGGGGGDGGGNFGGGGGWGYGGGGGGGGGGSGRVTIGDISVAQ